MNQFYASTPREGVLEGITRRTVMEIAQSLGIEVQLGPMSAAELRSAEEAFLTSSGGGVLPGTQVDGRRAGAPGPLTRQLLQTYWAWHRDPRYSTPVRY